MIARQKKNQGPIRSNAHLPNRIGQMLALVALTVSSAGLCGCNIFFEEFFDLAEECPPSLSVAECCEFHELRSEQVILDTNPDSDELSCEQFAFIINMLRGFGFFEGRFNGNADNGPQISNEDPDNPTTGDGSQGQDNPNNDDPNNDDPNDGGTVEELASKNVRPQSGTMIDQNCEVLSFPFLIGSLDIMLDEDDIDCTIRVTVTAKGNSNGRPNVLFQADGGDPVKVEGEDQDSNTTVLEFEVTQAGAAFAAFSESASLAESYDIKIEKICP